MMPKPGDHYYAIGKLLQDAKAKVAYGSLIYAVAFTGPLLIIHKGSSSSVLALTMLVHLCGLVTGYVWVHSGIQYYHFSYAKFCEFRLVPEFERLKQRNAKTLFFRPKFLVFLRAKNLKTLDEQFLQYIRAGFRRLEREDQIRRWQPRNDKLWSDLHSEFQDYGLSQEMISEFRETWDSLSPNPERRKGYVRKITSLLAQKSYELRTQSHPKTGPENRVEQQVRLETEDLRVKTLEFEASNCNTPQAQALYTAGLKEMDRRAKIRLFGQAIRTESKQDEETESAEEKQIAVRAISDSVEIDLNEILDETFQVADLVPEPIDAGMVKQILIELLGPGNRLRIWRTQERLADRARLRYARTKPDKFESARFTAALKWLIMVGVITSEPAHGETVYHMPRTTRRTKTVQARELTLRAVRLKQQFMRGA